MFFCGFFAVKNTQKAEALTSTAVTSNATKIGGGADLWDTKNQISSTVLKDLKSKLFGTDDPVTYIKNTATSKNIAEYNLTQSYVVPASVINAKIGGINSDYGYIVKFGGLDWMVASLTLSTTEQPVITLYLAQDNGTSQYFNYTKAGTKGANMYSSSVLRKTLLTSSTYSKFASGSLMKYLIQPVNIRYQKTESIMDRIDTGSGTTLPNDALNDPSPTWNSVYTNNGAEPYQYDFAFDGSVGNGLGTKQAPVRYDAWGLDYIWIPSDTETGTVNAMPDTCIWKLSAQQRKRDSGTTTWSRSGAAKNYLNGRMIDADGTFMADAVSATHGIRPAIHLNFEAVENSVTLSEPQAPAAPYIYDGSDKDLKGESWYKTNIFDTSLCTVTYADEDGVTVTPKDVGTYTATFKLNTTDYFWAGTNASTTRTATFKIDPKKLDVSFVKDNDTGLPKLSLTNTNQICGTDTVNCVIRYYDKDTEDKKDLGTDLSKLKGNTQYYAYAEFDNKNYVPNNPPVISFVNPATPVNVKWVDNEKSQEYTGDWLGFYLEDYDSDIIEVSYDDNDNFDGNNEFIEKDAGTYTVTLKLKDKQNYCWGPEMGNAAGKTDDTTIEFEIKPAVRVLKVEQIDPEWTVALGGVCNVELDPQPLIKGTGSVEVMIWAKRTQNANPIELCRVTLTEQADPIVCQFVTTGIRIKGNYIVGAQVADSTSAAAKNYSIIFDDDYTLTVEEAVQTSGIIWRLYSGNSIAGSMVDESGETSTVWNKTVTYNGKAYSFTVNPSGLGLTVDTSFGTKGYKTVAKSAPNKSLSTVTDAGDYVTTVKLSDGKEYSIEWTIQKAKFDLSGVRWIENGNITYAAGGVTVTLEPSTIPSGLTPVYGGTRSASNAGDSGTAEVTFTVADPDNYETPDKTVAGSYIFTPNGGLTDFEWGKNWTVSAMKIPVNWTVGTLALDSGSKINAEVLAGGFSDYIKYLYYETDASGAKLDPSAAGIDEPEVTENVIRYYIAEAQIKPDFGTNCEFASSANLVSPVFEVGRVLTAVQVTAKKTEYIYWGSPVNFLYNVQGAISSSAFDVSYYKGLTRLNGAPTDPGQYRAQLSLKSAYTASYYLDGTAAFDFTIVHAMVTVNWNESVKPPVLNLTQDQSRYVTYEYRDSAGNTVSFAGLSTPGIYDVIAKITDTSRYQFTGEAAANEIFTEWFEFEVKAGDTLTDPSSSLPAFTPSTDPNGGGEGGNQTSGKTPVDVWLKNTTVQAGESVQIGNTYGWGNDAFVITLMKDGQVVPNCNTAGNYTVMIELNSSTHELRGQTNFVFTVVEAGVPGGTTTTPGDSDANKNDGTTGNDPSDATIVSYLPIILSGVSLVLIVVFVIMTLNNLSAAKEAREKTKKLATMSYSFAPTGLLAIVLGLSEGNWWIIAGVLMALALIMAIVAFMSKGKKRKALVALEEEQTRVAEEKEYARREEMRMMFSSMQQQGGYAQPVYDDSHIQNLIASTVSALLPAMQQQMALPPAQDPSAYAPQPDYAARAENEALRAQLAQQQELLNQILQNQQAQQYAPYEEEPVDDISWLGVSDEVISLEESYGALSDEGKRAYYEIGSYIMNKPRTSQNDGRYAVLFKYRGRTIFKLCIKDDAPVLYYPAGNGGKSEVRIADPTSLEFAKSVVDRQTARVDSELN